MDVVNFIYSNGCSTGLVVSTDLVKSKLDCASAVSSTENSQNNAWNVNFNDGNTNNNNKYNSNRVRAVVALDDEIKEGWVIAKNDCCSNKKASPQCDEWRTDYELDLWILLSQVYSRTYTPATSTCFLVTWPKLREIFAAAFRDRIVQHWITLRLEPLFEKRFKECGDVSFNCRKGYGTLKAVHAVARDIVERSKNYTDPDVWIARFDLSSFFMSIDRQILWDMLEPFIEENYHETDKDILLYLTKIVVFHSPSDNCRRNSPLELWKLLPPHKSMFTLPPNKGEAIGNITSQQNANLYLSDFDEFMVWLCKRYNCLYERFVDDFSVVGDKDIILKIIRPLAEAYLRKHLKIKLHRDKFYIQPVRHGVKFVGSVIMPGRIYLSNRTVGGFWDELKRAGRICDTIAGGRVDEQTLGNLRHSVCALNSYLGFFIHCASFKLRMKLMLGVSPSFWQCCYITGAFQCVHIKQFYQLPNYLYRKEKEIYGTILRPTSTE